MEWIILGGALFLLLIICCSQQDNSSTFTVTCDRCGSTEVLVTHSGIKCRNCSSEMKF